MSDQNLTKKEVYDLKKAEEVKKYGNLRNQNLLKRSLLWVGVAALVGVSVWGLTKINIPSPEVQSAILLDAVSPSDWANGNKEANVILVEYSDFQCPACRAYYPIVEKLLQEQGDNFKFVYRHFPLPRHANAKGTAYAAEAAGKQGKFWEMHNMIFEHQNEWSGIGVGAANKMFLDYAASLNLDIEQFEKDRQSEEIKDKVEGDYQSGIRAGVNATPTFFLNGKQIQPRNYEDFVNFIKEADASNS